LLSSWETTFEVVTHFKGFIYRSLKAACVSST